MSPSSSDYRKNLVEITSKSTNLPPNGSSFSHKSCSSRCTACIDNLSTIGASSHMIILEFLISSTSLLWKDIWHLTPDFASIGIFNLECAVRPPKNSEEALPDYATMIAIKPFDLICARNTLYKKLFPVPPGPSRKNVPPVLDIALLKSISKASLCF
ncbi:hypothetical protein LIER_26878 [Lithospermum erythrorhizon]|uniref:Uncharacterized protein n=1 Tax=Lithospermum erythrorhizon TaxID=34254 RepID=A0AAV3RD76_LITER